LTFRIKNKRNKGDINLCTNQKYLDRQEEQRTYDQRREDIENHGYYHAFGVPSLERYEWLRENERLKGEW